MTGSVNLCAAVVSNAIFLNGSSISGDVILRCSRIDGQLNLLGARVANKLDMDSVTIGGSALLSEGAEFSDIVLRGAHITGQLALIRASVSANLTMNLIAIQGPLFLRESGFDGNIQLVGAKIEGQLEASGAKIKGKLDMNGASITDSLLIHGGAEAAEINLVGANIGTQVTLDRSKITGALRMNGARVGQSVFVRGAELQREIDLAFANIGGNLDMRATTFADVDLAGARVKGELRLASPTLLPTWKTGAELKLRNTRLDCLLDRPDAWPIKVDLHGFTYGRFGGFGIDAEAAISARGTKWFTDWLAKSEPYTPQPYQQCAKVLRGMGHPEMGDEVLYAGRERERKEALRSGNNQRATGLLFLKLFVGYGYGRRMLWHPLGWVIGMTVVGTAILHLTGIPAEPTGSLVTPSFFSFDLLLPVIQLYEPHYKVVLEGFAKYYFAFHKLMGYMLASFLIPGLAGLTK